MKTLEERIAELELVVAAQTETIKYLLNRTGSGVIAGQIMPCIRDGFQWPYIISNGKAAYPAAPGITFTVNQPNT